ncbi:MAG: diacylglycerol kinase family lipid kinase [Deltaproteobacteria bacterium]|nr:diacylglycerol kinase family lipid kinase [Deltaproteobacteria bacterium]
MVNPRSQNGALGREWASVARTIHRELGEFEQVMTSGPGHATELARKALKQGADVVVAIGGDGTLHEVANGFFDASGASIRSDTALGLIPFGTGGDFRKSAGIPKDVALAAQVIRNGTHRLIDVGRLEYCREARDGQRDQRIFVNIASFGIGGLVDRIVNSSTKALGGTVSFFLATARAALKYKNQRVRMIFDENEQDYLDMAISDVAVANGRYFGGGMHIAPRAELDDGQFDVVVLGDLTTLDFLTHGHRIYRGTHLGHPKVKFVRAKRVDAVAVDPNDEVLLDVDGEAPGALPATFTLLARALRIVVPPL